jgi:plasmid maintenance system antidote protein VapI
MSVSDQLKSAIRAYGTVYRLAQDSGIAQPVINRFVNGERDLKLATVDKLAQHLGLELKPRRAPRRAK